MLFLDWANHHTKRGSKKCSLLVCKIKKTETYSFLILSTSVYRVPTVGQVLCFLLVPTLFFRAQIGDVITTNVVWGTVANFPSSDVHSYSFGFVCQIRIDNFGLLSSNSDCVKVIFVTTEM